MTRSVTVGIDHSLSNSGVAVFGVAVLPRLKSCMASAPKNPDTEQELHRLQFMASRVYLAATELLLPDDDVWVVMEGPAQGMTSGKPHERAGLFWILANALHSLGYRITQAPPASVKKYWTGNGGAKKETMIEYGRRRFPGLIIKDDNVADALALGHMGHNRRGLTVPSAPGVDARSLEQVRWPDAVPDPTDVQASADARLFE